MKTKKKRLSYKQCSFCLGVSLCSSFSLLDQCLLWGSPGHEQLCRDTHVEELKYPLNSHVNNVGSFRASQASSDVAPVDTGIATL